MIDVVTDARCKHCHKPIVRVPGRRPREYCDDACKQKYYREHHAPKDDYLQAYLDERSTNVTLQLEIDRLQAKVAALEKFIDQERDIEERFRTDTRDYGFKVWLLHRGTAYASRSFYQKVKAPGFTPRGSRGTYLAKVRAAGWTSEEQSDFWTAWKDMLKDELFKAYYAAKGNQS
jgi:hypothetical protein